MSWFHVQCQLWKLGGFLWTYWTMIPVILNINFLSNRLSGSLKSKIFWPKTKVLKRNHCTLWIELLTVRQKIEHEMVKLKFFYKKCAPKLLFWILMKIRKFLNFASFETKYIKLKTQTQNNIDIFGIFHKKSYYYFGFFWNNLTKIPVFTKKISSLVFGFLVF